MFTSASKQLHPLNWKHFLIFCDAHVFLAKYSRLMRRQRQQLASRICFIQTDKSFLLPFGLKLINCNNINWQTISDIQWIFSIHRTAAGFSTVESIATERDCEKLRFLTQHQRKICQNYLDFMEAVREGAKEALEECRFQFRNRRWNCTLFDSKDLFGGLLKTGE